MRRPACAEVVKGAVVIVLADGSTWTALLFDADFLRRYCLAKRMIANPTNEKFPPTRTSVTKILTDSVTISSWRKKINLLRIRAGGKVRNENAKAR